MTYCICANTYPTVTHMQFYNLSIIHVLPIPSCWLHLLLISSNKVDLINIPLRTMELKIYT